MGPAVTLNMNNWVWSEPLSTRRSLDPLSSCSKLHEISKQCLEGFWTPLNEQWSFIILFLTLCLQSLSTGPLKLDYKTLAALPTTSLQRVNRVSKPNLQKCLLTCFWMLNISVFKNSVRSSDMFACTASAKGEAVQLLALVFRSRRVGCHSCHTSDRIQIVFAGAWAGVRGRCLSTADSSSSYFKMCAVSWLAEWVNGWVWPLRLKGPLKDLDS